MTKNKTHCIECGEPLPIDTTVNLILPDKPTVRHGHYHKGKGPLCDECYELYKETESVQDGTMGGRPVGYDE
jgi:hypothetical protein